MAHGAVSPCVRASVRRPSRRSHVSQGSRGEHRAVPGFRSHSSPREISAHGSGSARNPRDAWRFHRIANVRSGRREPDAAGITAITTTSRFGTRPASVAASPSQPVETRLPLTPTEIAINCEAHLEIQHRVGGDLCTWIRRRGSRRALGASSECQG